MFIMNNYESLVQLNNPDSVLLPEFEEHLIGQDGMNYRAIYDYNGCLDVVEKRDDVEYKEANKTLQGQIRTLQVEHGDNSPLFIHVFGLANISNNG
jgi:hypothetical protein